VIAEGVENAHQAEVLASLGYVLAQGFHYGRPQSRSAMIDTLTGTRPEHRAGDDSGATTAPHALR
jgi:EAL domain-containing protein (putative c-di-GMP-specific phosphodiesterase class I)